MTPDEIRRRAVEAANSIVGLSAGAADTIRRSKYLAFIAPGESPARLAEMAQMSPGGLVVAGIWRAVGVDEPELTAPYVTGTALSRLMKIAQRSGAWVPFAQGRLPSPGDTVLIGSPDHVYTVTAVTSGAVVEIRAVAGWLSPGGAPEILAMVHRWSGESDTLISPAPSAPDTRKITGWIDVTKLRGLAALPAAPQRAGGTPAGTASHEPPPSSDPIVTNVQGIRKRAVDFANSIIGLGANPGAPAERNRYLDLIMGDEPRSEAELFAKKVGSALVATGILRAVGLGAILAPPKSDDGADEPPHRITVSPDKLPPIQPRPESPPPKMTVRAPLGTLAGLGGVLPKPEATPPITPHRPIAAGDLHVDVFRKIEAPQFKLFGALPTEFTAKVTKADIASVASSIDLGALFAKKPKSDGAPAFESPAHFIDKPELQFIQPWFIRMLLTGRLDGSDGKALRDAAQRVGAWVPYSEGSLPKAGDVIFAGTAAASAGRIYVVTAISRWGSGASLVGVDSVRDPDGYAAVVARTHRWLGKADVVIGEDAAGSTEPLLVDGWIDLDRLASAVLSQPISGTQPEVKPAETIRDRAVRTALEVVGLGANPDDATSRRGYIELIASGEDPNSKVPGMLQMSGCGLTVRGIWRKLGFTEKELLAPYAIGTAISSIVAVARRADAWTPFRQGACPAPGDVVLVGTNGHEHVYTIVAVTQSGDAITIESVDGGQRDAEGYQTITAKKRVWRRGSADDALVTSDSTVFASVRPIVGWVDLDKLASLLGATSDHTTPPVTTPPSADEGWEALAKSGQPIPREMLEAIRARRRSIPAEPRLAHVNQMRTGHYYLGNTDPAHVAWLNDFLRARAAAAGNVVAQMQIEAMRALLRREGTTAAINTYDNMIVTWGIGFGGLGALPEVMDTVVQDPAAHALFRACGLGYWDDVYHVVDVDAGRVVSGRQEPLELIRGSLELLYLLIHAARSPETRDAVTLAQLAWISQNSASHAHAEEIATQALFTFVTHLKHWAPYYATEAVTWAAARADGERSPERDKQLARLVGRYFYGRARGWVPSWEQFKRYALVDMKSDGLDVTADPWFQAAGPTDLPNLG